MESALPFKSDEVSKEATTVPASPFFSVSHRRSTPSTFALVALLPLVGLSCPEPEESGCTDLDNDGFGAPDFYLESCASPESDCDDADSTAYPGAPERPYDGIDQDCDGVDGTCPIEAGKVQVDFHELAFIVHAQETGRIYVSGWDELGSIAMIDTGTWDVLNASVGSHHAEPALAGDGTLYVSSYYDGIEILDAATLESLDRVAYSTPWPHSCVSDRNNNRVFCHYWADGSFQQNVGAIVAIDTTSREVVGDFSLDYETVSLAMAPNGEALYASLAAPLDSGAPNAVVEIDPGSGAVGRQFDCLGTCGGQIEVDERYLYSKSDQGVEIFSLDSGVLDHVVPIDDLSRFKVSSDGEQLFASGTDQLRIFDASTGSLLVRSDVESSGPLVPLDDATGTVLVGQAAGSLTGDIYRFDTFCLEYLDADGDGLAPADGDCEDGDVNVFPGADEIIADGIDQDCDGEDSPPILSDDFDDHAVGTFPDGWSLVHSGHGATSQVVDDEFASSDPHSFKLEGGVGYSASARHAIEESPDLLTFEARVLVGDVAACVPGNTAVFSLSYLDGSTQIGLTFSSNHTGNEVTTADGTASAEYEIEVWYSVKIVFDRSTSKFAVWFDDELLADDMSAGAGADYDGVDVGTGSCHVRIWFDDILVY